jgi:hypothetical protein
MKFEPPFGQFPLALLEDSRLNWSERLVWIVLETWTDNDTGTCHPSIPAIAKRAGLSVRSTIRALEGLEDKGWLRRTSTRGARTRYTLFAKPAIHAVAKPHADESSASVALLGTAIPAKPARRTAAKPLSSESSATVTPLAQQQSRERKTKSSATQALEVVPHRHTNYTHSILSKEKERVLPNPLFELRPEPKRTPKHASIDDLWQQKQARPEPEQTPREEQARAKAAADCTYGEDRLFHIGPIALAWLQCRNLEHFTLNRLIGDDEDDLEAAGPWEPIADPLGHLLKYVEAYAKKFQADKAEKAAKEAAVLEARKLERRQKFEERRDKRSQDGDA